MNPLGYGLNGVGGYAAVHLEAILRLQENGEVKLEAVAEAFQERHRATLEGLKSRGVRLYADYREMLDSEPGLQIVSVPTPIHLHFPMAAACFERSLHVMLEKPPAPLVQQVDSLIAAAQARGLLCQVGFQNIADPCARALKARLAEGAIGRIRDVVVVGKWQRLDSYYSRAAWAGRLKLEDDWVLDGPLNNPMCHYVHEALFLVGPGENETARPLSVRAELYHAHPIEAEDIVCARAELEGGVTMYTYLTTCGLGQDTPIVDLIGDRGRAQWSPGRYRLQPGGSRAEEVAIRPDGLALFVNLVRAVRGEEALLSPLRATRNVILHNNGCYASTGTIRPVPESAVRRYAVCEDPAAQDTATEVEELCALIDRAADARKLFSELDVTWAMPTPSVALDFDSFDPSRLLAAR